MKESITQRLASLDKYLVGMGLGNAVGGFIGMFIVPFGWFTLMYAVITVVGAYIAYDTYVRYYGTRIQS